MIKFIIRIDRLPAVLFPVNYGSNKTAAVHKGGFIISILTLLSADNKMGNPRKSEQQISRREPPPLLGFYRFSKSEVNSR